MHCKTVTCRIICMLPYKRKSKCTEPTHDYNPSLLLSHLSMTGGVVRYDKKIILQNGFLPILQKSTRFIALYNI